MKSFYRRQFAMVAGLILVSFLLLGITFATLSYRYTIGDKRDTLERNASFIAQFTAEYRGQGMNIREGGFRAYLYSLASISNAHVLLCEKDGQIVYSADGQNQGGLDSLVGGYMPSGVIRQVLTQGEYASITNLGGMYMENRYVTGLPIQVDNSNGTKTVIGMTFVSAETDSITQMWRALSGIFIFTAVIVAMVAFIFTSMTSHWQTRPLKEMAAAVRRFGHGEFDVRVSDCGRGDEVGELARSFNAMADSLAQSEARRSEFVANISHELKTPMTTIAGFADGILDGTITENRAQGALRTISAETRRLSRLVRRMLDISRPQTDAGITAQEQFNVSEIAARVLVSLEKKVSDKQLDVIAQLPAKPLLVWGDPDAITQVCYNLLENAIKFAREGGHLWVEVAPQGGKALVTIRDEGETIPPEELPLIFDRFHKTDHSRSVDRDGVGLGLYIVKTILNGHKEGITVISEDGITQFQFTLTLA